MAECIRLPEQTVFGLDIGTRSIVGTVGYMDRLGFHVAAMEVKEHASRAMLDGQVHDISVVGEEILTVKNKLEKKTGRKLTGVCIAAAGRALKTITVHQEMDVDIELKITREDIYTIDHAAIESAHRQINEDSGSIRYYCVGYTPVKYFLNNNEIGNLEGHKGSTIGVDLLATFLPEEVVDGLYASVEYAGLEVANLTLEPIAAMNVAIPERFRLLNIALLDVGAGTSDICITKDGSIIAYGMIPSAGDELTEQIAKHYLVDFATAEKIKIGAGGKKKIQFKDILGIGHSVDPAEVHKITKPVADHITQEVADKIIALNGGKTVSAVFVVGGGGKMASFTEMLAKKLSLPHERVAIRGKEVLGGVEFAVTNVKKDSLYVTPIGICINYYNQKNNFIFVTVNATRIKLYDNDRLTVIDAIMQSGYPNEKLFPRRGPSIQYTFNKTVRMIRGRAGEPAKITKNGVETTLSSGIAKNDYIDIIESTVGEAETVRLGELPEIKMSVSFQVNGKTIRCPRFAYVNGQIKTDSYIIQNKDKIVMEDFYLLEQLFTFMDIPLEDKEVFVNNEPADAKTKVYANFQVRYAERDIFDMSAPYEEEDKTSEPQEPEPAKAGTAITVTVNQTPVTLTGKDTYTYVNILDFYPFDLSTMGGEELVKTVNGEAADFTTPIREADVIELYWK